MKRRFVFIALCLTCILISRITAQSSELLSDLFSEPDCFSICWLGIKIGDLETAMVSKLSAANIRYEKNALGLSEDLFTYGVTAGYTHPLINASKPIVIIVSAGEVVNITMFLQNISLNEVVATYGAPKQLVKSGDSSVALAYPHYGIAFMVLQTDPNMIDRVNMTSEQGIERGYLDNPYFPEFESCNSTSPLCLISTATPGPLISPTPTIEGCDFTPIANLDVITAPGQINSACHLANWLIQFASHLLRNYDYPVSH